MKTVNLNFAGFICYQLRIVTLSLSKSLLKWAAKDSKVEICTVGIQF